MEASNENKSSLGLTLRPARKKLSVRGNALEDIFIGDIGDPTDPTDDTIKHVNISTGEVRTFASTNFANGLNGVMGLILTTGN
jgi:hypothetical protein